MSKKKVAKKTPKRLVVKWVYHSYARGKRINVPRNRTFYLLANYTEEVFKTRLAEMEKVAKDSLKSTWQARYTSPYSSYYTGPGWEVWVEYEGESRNDFGEVSL